MAGVTRPRIIKGMRNWRKLLKILLKVAKTRTAGTGKILPKKIPKIIAIIMRGNKPRRNFFISCCN